MNLTWHGHACFEIETRQGKRIIVDPFLNDNPKADVKPGDLDPDFVVVTHGHSDHFGDALAFKKPVIGIYEIAIYCQNKGLDSAVGMNIGGTYEADGVKFTLTQAVHSAGMASDGPFLGLGGSPCGVVIDDGERRVYHAGDTGLFGDMKAVIGAIHKPDVALLPIGGFYTMDPQLAAIATEWLGVKHVVPMHYGTFRAIEQDPGRFAKLVAERCEAKVLVVGVGERVQL